MVAIIKDFKRGQLTQEEVFNELKNGSGSFLNGSLKLMCGDAQYSRYPGGNIEKVYFDKNGNLKSEIIYFNWPNAYLMFHHTSDEYTTLPYGPWYEGYIDDEF